MAKITLQIVGDNSRALQSVAEIQRKLNDIERNPIEIKIDAVGDTEVLKMQAKLEQARASTARANAKIAESEAKVKIARQQTKTVTAQQVLEEKKAETAKKQATLATKKAAQAEKETQRAIENTNTAQKKKELQEERTKTKIQETTLAQEKAKAAAEKRANAEEKGVSATKKQETATKNLTSTIQQYIEWYLRWTVVSGAFQAAVGGIKEALQTMKAVDDELVTVRKVTGFAEDQMQRVEEQAYKTASAYGVAANEYLESVASFARAGYKEQSAALAELATKTQIVGDTTADVANQFLLSVDAAYKYNGSIEDLTRVLDGANEIDNKYATSIEKIASGMGIVAPVAAQMHVGIDELAASIGTITAVTQRSGTEAARALRALFLNIAGDTKTEIDEGVTWTTGEIEGLRDVIKQYSKDAYDAAQATGSIINPMKAMEGLAKSMKEGALSEQKLIEMVSDIGGKLRTSQLLAIIQNWDMYQSMLQDYAGAIGSADKEVANALDSWSRKTAQLKNAWTEFISHLIETKQIKGAIDLLTGAVKLLDSSLGKAAVTAGLLFAALKVTGALNGLVALISGLVTTIGGLTTATELFNVVWAQSPFMVVAIGAAAIYGIVKAVDALTVTYDEQKEKLEELETQYNKTYGNGSELDTLRKKTSELTQVEKNRLAVLEAEEAVLARQIAEQQKLAFLAWRGSNSELKYTANKFGGLDVQYVSKTGDEAERASKQVGELIAQYQAGELSATEFKQKLQELTVSLQSSAEAIRAGRDAGVELTAEEKTLLALYDALVRRLSADTGETKKNTEAKQENAEAAGKAAQAGSALSKAFEEVDSKSSLTYGTIKQLDAIYPGFSAKILDASGNLTAEGKAALSSRSALFDLISAMISANTTSMNFDGQIAALRNLATEAGIAAGAISMIFSTMGAETGSWDEVSNMTPTEYAQYRMNNAVTGLMAEMKKKAYATTTNVGGGGGGGSTEDPELTKKKEAVSYLKQELAFLEASGASVADQVAKQRKIQEALHDQAEYMRTIEGESANVKALSTEWWNIQKKISDLAEKEAEAAAKKAEEEEKAAQALKDERLAALKENVALLESELNLMEAQDASYDEQIAKIRQIQQAIDAQLAEMQQQGASQREINELLLKREKLEDSILQIQKKQTEEAVAIIEAQMKQLDAEKDARVKALRQQLDALKSQKDEQDQITTLAEKELAVRKALEALENARRERNVRQYNAKSGQWEWVADPKAIKDAEKAWEDAKKAVEEYESDIEYQNQVKAIEAQIDAVEAEYASMKDALQAMIDELEKTTGSLKKINADYAKIVGDLDKLSDGDASLKAKLEKLIGNIGSDTDMSEETKTAILQMIGNMFSNPDLSTDAKKKLVDSLDILFSDKTLKADAKTKIVADLDAILTNKTLTAESKTAIINGLNTILGTGQGTDAATLFTNYIKNALKTNDPKTAIKELCDAINSGVITNLNDVSTILKMLNGDYAGISASTAKLFALTKMQANSVAWHLTTDTNTRNALHAENVQIGNAIGLSYNSKDGTWHDASGKQVYTLNAVDGAWSSTLNDSSLGGTGTGTGTGTGGTGTGTSTGSGTTITWTDPSTGVSYDIDPYQDTINPLTGEVMPSTYGQDNRSKYEKTQNTPEITYKEDGTIDTLTAIDNQGNEHTISYGTFGRWIDNVLDPNAAPLTTGKMHINYAYNVGVDANGHKYLYGYGIKDKTEGIEVRFFDRGGILHGTGGIKATASDEMVLPPGMTSRLLNAEMTGAFDALLRHLGIVTAAADSIAGFGGGITRNSIGEQHNGDVFYIDGIELKNITGSTTLNDLARCAKNLALQRGS